MRSMLICGKPILRACSYARPISGDRCARPFSSRILSSKFSTPRLSRVTPRRRMTSELGLGQRARLALERDLFGAPAHGVRAVSRVTSDSSCSVERNDGVPPPKYTKSIGRPASAGCARSSVPLTRQQVQVLLHLPRVLVGVDAEVAEMAALPAERDVQVQAERRARGAGGGQRRQRLAARRRRASRPKTAGNWRRNNCRPPARPHPSRANQSRIPSDWSFRR